MQSRWCRAWVHRRAQSVGGKKPHVLLGPLPEDSGQQRVGGQKACIWEEEPGAWPWDLLGCLWRVRAQQPPRPAACFCLPSPWPALSGEVWG